MTWKNGECGTDMQMILKQNWTMTRNKNYGKNFKRQDMTKAKHESQLMLSGCPCLNILKVRNKEIKNKEIKKEASQPLTISRTETSHHKYHLTKKKKEKKKEGNKERGVKTVYLSLITTLGFIIFLE